MAGMDPPRDVTQVLARMQQGDAEAAGLLIPLVYDEMRRIAGHYMRQERSGHTLQATALVHEAYLRLAEDGIARFENRAHFFTAAAQLMRWILLDHARRRTADKRGGGGKRVELEGIPAPDPGRTAELLAVEEGLTRLEKVDPRQARIVELRYFIGLNIEETAEALGISTATVKREWSMARAFLKREVAERA
jgi:RNA polymerase sigma-70 factor, ECF subfamily